MVPGVGVRLVKNKAGKITHVPLSMKHHAKLPEDIVDHAEIIAIRNGEIVPWSEARERVNKK